MRHFVFVQARMGSSRLPGKVLKPLAGKPQLLHLIERLGQYSGSGSLVVVTSTERADDAIEQFCSEHEVKCHRGSEDDVLDRFYQAAIAFGANAGSAIVRVTADCPLHHEDVVRFALDHMQRHELDYFSNSFAPYYEDGCDTEVFTFAALETAWKNAKLASQREHVTPYIKDSGIFLCGYKKFHPDYKFKLSVDTPADHAAVESIFRSFPDGFRFTISDVVGLINKNPALLNVNKDSVINAGYAKSLANDKEVK